MSTSPILVILLVLVFAWLAAISALLFFLYQRFKKLLSFTEEDSFMKLFKNIENSTKQNNKDIVSLRKDFSSYIEASKVCLKKVALMRFNPFDETGGNNSFSLSVLDENDDGFVMTGLHTRERTRLYLKPVKNKKSELELSKEEKLAIEKASQR